MPYQRKKFNTEAFAVYEGETYIKSFKYYKVAKRFVSKQPNSDMYVSKTERVPEEEAATPF